MNAPELRRRFLLDGRPEIAPSLLSADFASLRGALEALDSASAHWLHLDVMDGHFVPNITFGPPLVKSLRQADAERKFFFDAHLMIDDPLRYAGPFAEAGADLVTFHAETRVQPGEMISELRKLGVGAGVSIKPDTPPEKIEALLPDVDLVLVMTVEPGFGGQKMIPACLDKVRWLASKREEAGLDFILQVDGGVNEATIGAAVASGAESLVAGSAVFGDGSEGVARRLEALEGSLA